MHEKGGRGRLFSACQPGSSLGGGDHLPCMRQRLFGEVDAAEHSGDLLDTAVLIQFGDGRAGFICPASLVHEQVVMPLGGDLR